MSAVKVTRRIQDIIEEIDRLIADMITVRSRVAALGNPPIQSHRSVREAEYFGMWADREDMRRLSSSEWLKNPRSQQ